MKFTDYFLLRLVFTLVFRLCGLVVYILLALLCLVLGIRIHAGHRGQYVPRLHARRNQARTLRHVSYRHR